jgi:hypothetical protein
LSRRVALAVLVTAVASWVPACASEQQSVRFSERPELRAEEVSGCGGGGLRFLEVEPASAALRSAGEAELEGEPPHAIESAWVPCAFCDEHGGVCGYVVARFSEPLDGRTGVRLRFRSTVAKAAEQWSVVDSERVLDDARLAGDVKLEDARLALEWARDKLDLEGPVDSVVGPDRFDRDAPAEAALRLAQLVRVGDDEVLFRHIFVRRAPEGFAVVEDRRVALPADEVPPPVRHAPVEVEEPSLRLLD